METTELASALARRLASHQIDDDQMRSLADAIGDAGHLPNDLDICTLGICVDYFVRPDEMTRLFERLQWRRGPIRVFPKGIIAPDGFLVRVEHELSRGR